MFLAYRSSFQCGVMCLRRLNYDRKELELRRDESQIEVKGKQASVCFFFMFVQLVKSKKMNWSS